MRVTPVNEYLSSIIFVEPTPLDPPENPFMSPAFMKNDPSSMSGLLQNVQKIKKFYIQLKTGKSYDQAGSASSGARYEMYLQFPNSQIRELARSIVNPSDTNDEKAYKILMWVQENIEYVSDTEGYGRPEHWAFPTTTAERGAGDCEDGAFLIHSLMLSAGIPYDRIRTYGGAVFAGPGAPAGGHAWTAYMRETDDEWVNLDWCYFPEDTTVAGRTPLREDSKYFDDWFYVDALKTIDATFTNNLRAAFVDVIV